MHRVSILAILLIVILAGILQATAFEYISIAGIKPDLLLVVVIFFSISCQRADSIKTSVPAGIIKDLTSSLVLGSYTFSFLLLGLLLNLHQNKFYKEKFFTQTMLGFFSYMIMGVLALAFNSIAASASFFQYQFFIIVIKGAIYTAIITPLVFFLLSRVLRFRFTQSF